MKIKTNFLRMTPLLDSIQSGRFHSLGLTLDELIASSIALNRCSMQKSKISSRALLLENNKLKTYPFRHDLWPIEDRRRSPAQAGQTENGVASFAFIFSSFLNGISMMIICPPAETASIRT